MKAMTMLAMMLVVMFATLAMAQEYVYKTVKGDTPLTVAAKNGLNPLEVKNLFGAKSLETKLRTGQQIRITKETVAAERPAAPTVQRKSSDVIAPMDMSAEAMSITEEMMVDRTTDNSSNLPPSAATESTPSTTQVVDQEIAAAANVAAKDITEVPSDAKAALDNESSEKEKTSRPFAFGKHFNEASLTAGGGKNLSSPAYFYYVMGEMVHWVEQKDAGRNFGLGALALFNDWEDGRGKFRSSGLSVMGQLGWYEIIGAKEDTHFLLKLRGGVKIHLDDSKDKSDPIIGVYSEIDHKTSLTGRVGVSFDFMDELKKKKEGYFVARPFYEHIFESKKRLMIGVGPIDHFDGKENNWGISPVVSLRIPFDRNNALTLGVIGDFTGGGRNSVGAFATYAWDDIRYKTKDKK